MDEKEKRYVRILWLAMPPWEETLAEEKDYVLRPDGSIDLNLAESLLSAAGEERPDLNLAERVIARMRDEVQAGHEE